MGIEGFENIYPKGPCTLLLYTWAPKSLYRKYFKAQVYNNEVHGPLGIYIYINGYTGEQD